MSVKKSHWLMADKNQGQLAEKLERSPVKKCKILYLIGLIEG
jgi:hypothetical protein